MISFQVVTLFLSTAILTLALPTPMGKGACTPNVIEHFNLAHHHDVNTGLVIAGQKIIDSKIKYRASGCSPIWAGGVYDDSAHFSGKKYPEWLLQKMSGTAAPPS